MYRANEGRRVTKVSTMKMRDGAVIAYRLWQPAQARRLLILLHGLASNRTRWSEFVADTRLRESWDILTLDLRGMGQSVYRGRIGMAEWCADIADLLAALGYSRAVLAGHCLGANIALEFAARHPQQVQGLILIEPMPREAMDGAARRLVRLRPILMLLAGIVRAANALGCYRRRLEFLDLLALDRETRAALRNGKASEGVLEKYASPFLDLRSTPTGAFLQGLIALTGRTPDLSALTIPVLSMLSSGSTFSKVLRTRAALAELQDQQIIELEALHWIPLEQPDAMRDAMESWLATGRQSGAGEFPEVSSLKGE